jgi:hypothetical protein
MSELLERIQVVPFDPDIGDPVLLNPDDSDKGQLQTLVAGRKGTPGALLGARVARSNRDDLLLLEDENKLLDGRFGKEEGWSDVGAGRLIRLLEGSDDVPFEGVRDKTGAGGLVGKAWRELFGHRPRRLNQRDDRLSGRRSFETVSTPTSFSESALTNRVRHVGRRAEIEPGFLEEDEPKTIHRIGDQSAQVELDARSRGHARGLGRTGGGGERCRCHGPAVGCENGLPTAPIVELRIRVRLGGDDGVALGVDRKPFDNQEFSLIRWTGRSLPPRKLLLRAGSPS